MTQNSVAKPSAAASAKVVVFGLDSNWRPHAAWFPHTQADRREPRPNSYAST